MKRRVHLESSPHSDQENNKTEGDESMHSPRIPNFKQIDNDLNGHKLHIPEENKVDSEPRMSLFKIDFANDPVMKSLLEAKQDQFALALQRMYLSKNCRCAYFALAVI